MKKKARIAVLVSGGGTNLQAILDAAGRGELSDGEVTLVISDRAGAYALERATMAGIPSVEINKKACGGQKAFEEKLLAALEENRTDLIVLAGFLSILTEDFTARYPRRIINVHPSLIPSFCGAGYYGLKVHEAALHRSESREDRIRGYAGDPAAQSDGTGGMGDPSAERREDLQRNHKRIRGGAYGHLPHLYP